MTTSLIVVKPETPLIEAVHLMLQDDISGLPVVDNAGDLVGILTESDLLRREELGTERFDSRWIEQFRLPAAAEAYARSRGRKVGDVMTSPVTSIDAEASLSELVAVMEERQINRVLVTDGGRLVGIVARADLLRALARILERPESSAADGASQLARLWEELGQQPWMPTSGVKIEVRDGIATLSGTVAEPRVRDAIRVAAERTPGIRAVDDRVALPSDAAGNPLRRLASYLPTSLAGARSTD